MTVTCAVISVLIGLFGFTIGLLVSDLRFRRIFAAAEERRQAREDFLRKIADSERDLLLARIERVSADAAVERKELYSRIQAYDPNVGDYTAPSYTAPPSRPGEEKQQPRSFTEEDLGEMGLVVQADEMIRDTRNDALFETFEDWRAWQADLKKKHLPENVHPAAVQELGWEQAVTLAKQQAAEKKAAAKS